MKWSRLKTLECPNGQCEGIISRRGGIYECNRCPFIITAGRFDELINKLYTSRTIYQQPEDNLSDLNNLGRKKMSEDFSDSPHINI